MTIRQIKKPYYIFFSSSIFSVLWLLLLNFVEPLRGKNYEFVTFVVFIAFSAGISLLFTRKYLRQKDKSILKRIGLAVLTAALSFAVIVGVFYIAVFGLLSLH